MDINNCLTLPAPAFRRATGISNERFYQLVAAGELETFVLGSRRFVVIKSYLALIERRKKASEKRAAPPRRPTRPRQSKPTLVAVEPDPAA